MPWLSWNVFHRTSAHSNPESLKQLYVELKNWLSSGTLGPVPRSLHEGLSRVARPVDRPKLYRCRHLSSMNIAVLANSLGRVNTT
jgi:hypothetical protein